MNVSDFLENFIIENSLTDHTVKQRSPLTGTLRIDARYIEPGDVFLVIPPLNGSSYESHIQQAEQKGAALILDLPQPRQLWTKWAKYCFPSQPRICVGVTGTNGKTSTVEFTRQLWQYARLPAASLGTLGLNRGLGPIETLSQKTLTSPDAWDLHACLEKLANENVHHVALEASSHGLDQYRLEEVHFSAVAFTHLNHEHLDYHKTMEAYFEAKARLFRELLPISGHAILSSEDSYGRRLHALCLEKKISITTFGRGDVDLRLDRVEPDSEGLHLRLTILGRSVEIHIPVRGIFQSENILAALGLVLTTGLSVDQAIEGLKHLKSIPGRMEYIGQTAHGGKIYVDYSHKPQALFNVLTSLKVHGKGEITVVLGCGGNRDAGKRVMMGKIAAQNAHHVIVTDDNPRDEVPALIRAEILQGCPEALEIGSRSDAIAVALSSLKNEDICIIAGKGHEEGQIIGDKIIPFNDAEMVRRFLKTERGRIE